MYPGDDLISSSMAAARTHQTSWAPASLETAVDLELLSMEAVPWTCPWSLPPEGLELHSWWCKGSRIKNLGCTLQDPPWENREGASFCCCGDPRCSESCNVQKDLTLSPNSKKLGDLCVRLNAWVLYCRYTGYYTSSAKTVNLQIPSRLGFFVSVQAFAYF